MRNFDIIRLKLYIYLHNYLYNRISSLSTKLNNGIHPKHRIMDFHKFFLNNLEKDAKVLDIGCGIGALTNDIAKKAKLVVGIDINAKSIETAKKKFNQPNIEYIVADATNYDFNQKFDYIILSNVLEHIKDRYSFLKRIKLVSNNLLIRVPLYNRSWLTVYKKQLGLEYRLDKSHFVEYTTKTFKKEMKYVGLDIESFEIQFGEIWAKARYA
ncbi:MAG: class I SAM-dependent methyltransferase [Candidatus Thorarchaeota archaeon]